MKEKSDDVEIVGFVILHYKDQNVTDQCVRSILKLEQQERIRIVIVDNDIHENRMRRQKLRQRYAAYGNLAVLSINENGGFSYANNQGYTYAKEVFRASFILVLNNDIEFIQKDFLSRLDKSYQKYPYQVMGPDIIRRCTGEHQNPMDERPRTKAEAEYTVRMNRWGLKYYGVLYPLLYWNNRRMEWKRYRKNRKNSNWYKAVQSDKVLFGACLIFTPQFVRQEDQAFFPETSFYYEEYILALRCQKCSYRTIYVPELKVLHESGTATKSSFHGEKERLRFVMERVAESSEIYQKYLS